MVLCASQVVCRISSINSASQHVRAHVFSAGTSDRCPRRTLGMKSNATKLIVATCAAKGVGPRKPMTKAQISQNHLGLDFFAPYNLLILIRSTIIIIIGKPPSRDFSKILGLYIIGKFWAFDFPYPNWGDEPCPLCSQTGSDPKHHWWLLGKKWSQRKFMTHTHTHTKEKGQELMTHTRTHKKNGNGWPSRVVAISWRARKIML